MADESTQTRRLISLSEEHDRLYLEYGSLFNQLKARSWVLKPGVISVAEGPACANIFETPGHCVTFVGLGKQQKKCSGLGTWNRKHSKDSPSWENNRNHLTG